MKKKHTVLKEGSSTRAPVCLILQLQHSGFCLTSENQQAQSTIDESMGVPWQWV